ncbi:unnamed protein product [Nezara viridula]|uniref:Uncharacterized protein n=1 Tax=Nezara viridula TaxID=85310 RepID=A0A9P0GXW3_NEZVI|nr:unnamed protein product [Nezara viridula]
MELDQKLFTTVIILDVAEGFEKVGYQVSTNTNPPSSGLVQVKQREHLPKVVF